MGRTSKELLQLEHKNPSSSSLESALLVSKRESVESQRKKTKPDEKPTSGPLPKSQVLGKVKDFLGVISESNKRLQLDEKDNSENYDIEVLNGNESQVIEMDLMLGIADLHTPDAVAAAESAIAGCQPVIPLAVSSTETESDDSSDEDDESDENDHDEGDGSENEDALTLSSTKLKRSKSAKDNSSDEAGNKKSEKRPKIVEL